MGSGGLGECEDQLHNDVIEDSFGKSSESSVFSSPVSPDISVATCLGMEDIQGIFALSSGPQLFQMPRTDVSLVHIMGEVISSSQNSPLRQSFFLNALFLSSVSVLGLRGYQERAWNCRRVKSRVSCWIAILRMRRG